MIVTEPLKKKRTAKKRDNTKTLGKEKGTVYHISFNQFYTEDDHFIFKTESLVF